MAHTKGKWIEAVAQRGGVISINGGNGCLIAEAVQPCDMPIITAAPLLLEALERLCRIASVELKGKRDDVLEQAEAAIKAALGEEV